MTDSSIQVVVRVRPLNAKEASLLAPIDTSKAFQGDGGLAASPSRTQSTIAAMRSNYIRNIIAPVDDRVLVFDPVEPDMVRGSGAITAGSGSSHSIGHGTGDAASQCRSGTFSSHMQFHGNSRRPRDVRYAFDRVFPPSTTQREVYRGTIEPMFAGLLSGFNASVFAYGATGCGKTHTISGTSDDPGLIFLTMQGLYERIAAESHEYETDLRLSYLEIYNETIRDLLSETPTPAGRGLALREDAARKISVVGITEHIPESPEQVLDMITEGNKRRTQSPTEANAVSSRSHAVLQVNVTRRPRTADTVEEMCSASLNIIDLAGSERASATTNHGMRMKEGANINRSLLALGSCINALCQSNVNQRGGTRSRHIPYRNSKLTRLLKFSLGGNCKTVMIACVSPSSAHYDETHNTLKYANQAKNIQTKVSRNLLHIDRHVAQYVQAIASLRSEIAELKEKLARTPHATTYDTERAAQLEQAHAQLIAAAARAKDGVPPGYATSYAAHATLRAAKTVLASCSSDAEVSVLRGLIERCGQADTAGALDVPAVPHEAPPLVAQHDESEALYDAMHAHHAAEVRAYTHERAREAFECVLTDVLAPRMVSLLTYAARATSALQQACGAVAAVGEKGGDDNAGASTYTSAAVQQAWQQTLAEGSALLQDMTGVRVSDTKLAVPVMPTVPTVPAMPAMPAMPAAPKINMRRLSKASAISSSPARILRKSPRRRVLRPSTQRHGTGPGPGPSISSAAGPVASRAAGPRLSKVRPRTSSTEAASAPTASIAASSATSSTITHKSHAPRLSVSLRASTTGPPAARIAPVASRTHGPRSSVTARAPGVETSSVGNGAGMSSIPAPLEPPAEPNNAAMRAPPPGRLARMPVHVVRRAPRESLAVSKSTQDQTAASGREQHGRVPRVSTESVRPSAAPKTEAVNVQAGAEQQDVPETCALPVATALSGSPPSPRHVTQKPAKKRGLFQRQFLTRPVPQDDDADLEEASDGLLEFPDDDFIRQRSDTSYPSLPDFVS
mgnify:FL=1